MGLSGWSSPIMMIISFFMCYLAVSNYMAKELGRDISTVTYEEAAVYVKGYAYAMLIGAFAAFFVHSSEMRRKVYLLAYGTVVMLVTTDQKWDKKKLPDPDSIKGQPTNTSKRIIFIRHGESLWNEAFNGSKRPDKFLYQVAKALVGEFMLLPEFDSVLLDSPLNELGFSQAKLLSRALASWPRGVDQELRTEQLARDVASLRGDPEGPTSVVVTSNLRRAAQTAVVALWARFKPLDEIDYEEDEDGDFDHESSSVGSGGVSMGQVGQFPETIKVLSALQEVSRNVDTLSLTGTHSPVPLQGVQAALNLSSPVDAAELFSCAHNAGNKPVFGTGLHRMQTFCEWVFSQEEEVVICAGHSLWFKHFFNTYLPASAEGHDALDCKMKNGGCVAFTLERGKSVGSNGGHPDVFVHRADPDSITIVDGGFDNKKKLQKAAAKAKKAS
eukprot:CAMPEP_0171828408 /NCGR_PEP_ID=MMETSP0992-20121227/7157_1 /TAXON_ID=483369 /ORGANISM="non described non described, Strain CCMP2098" /LENGTH=442 /DNA_ID=CAMNT_0012443609 /DNA_START=37 /DNA_END=1365 /DNA_ORIENTATION=+